MKQVKPVVVGYLIKRYAGKWCDDTKVYSKKECEYLINNDKFLRKVGLCVDKKAKFRPVYDRRKVICAE